MRKRKIVLFVVLSFLAAPALAQVPEDFENIPVNTKSIDTKSIADAPIPYEGQENWQTEDPKPAKPAKSSKATAKSKRVKIAPKRDHLIRSVGAEGVLVDSKEASTWTGGVRLSQMNAVSDKHLLLDSQVVGAIGLGEQTSKEDGRKSLAIGVKIGANVDLGAKILNTTCSPYVGVGAGLDGRVSSSFSAIPTQNENNIGMRVGVGMACVGENATLIVAPIAGVAADISRAQNGSTARPSFGLRSRLMVGDSFAAVLEVIQKLPGFMQIYNQETDAVLAVQFLPWEHLALGLEGRVSGSRWVSKVLGLPHSQELAESALTQEVRGTVAVGF